MATPAGLPDIDDNRSTWAANNPAPEPYSPLVGDTSADVAIVGGGFTGMSTAYHLARRWPERRVVLLEAKRLANGGSGRNGGLMLNWVNGVEPGDPERAKSIFDATREGIDIIEGIIKEHALSVRWRRDGSLHVHTRSHGAEIAQAEVEALAGVGVPLRFLSGRDLPDTLRLAGARGAVLDPTAGHLDGVSYLRALAPVVAGLGVAIHEDTPVLSIVEGKECVLTTPRGTVRAKAIVLATNAYTPWLGYFKDQIFPLHAHVVSTEARDAATWAAKGWSPGVAGFDDDLDRIAYGCMTTRGEVVFGGGHNAAYGYRYGGKTSWDQPADFESVHRRFLQYMPDAADIPVAHRWTGPVALTWNRICAMGVRGEANNVYYALGYSGHGVTLANLAGKVLCDLYSGADERWRGQPFYRGPMAWMPPEPLRWIGYHVVTALTGKSPRKRGVRH
ncbi:MAG: FAD-dependent oxidoreductase [Deltaproteobacteria bacterium]|nr:FAD-dependent oxidoreductase [Deltaproteobacteria bacterium]